MLLISGCGSNDDTIKIGVTGDLPADLDKPEGMILTAPYFSDTIRQTEEMS